ncbi:hypothetical protein BdWA1_003093 [Babesia duncani]|uniref:Uncharacterized protein n=1 Tax=Babesia duncani TaxID=323732 RepID=A0AAD9UN59_9APIC|nr:hypothetical protein BdWA1_003093 [Babesia duncani]
MVLNRNEEIDKLQKVYPVVKSSGLFNITCRIYLRSILNNSNCIIELTIPRTYPSSRVTASLTNPMPHAWLRSNKTLEIPEDIIDKPLVNIVEAIISMFDVFNSNGSSSIEPDGVSNEVAEKDKSEEYKQTLESQNAEADRLAIKCIKNSPVEPFDSIKEMSSSDVKNVSKETARDILLSSKELQPLIHKLKECLVKNEDLINEGLSIISKRKDLLEEFDEISKNIESNNFLSTATQSSNENRKQYIKRLNQEIEDLHSSITIKTKELEMGTESLSNPNVRMQVMTMFEKLNHLFVLKTALGFDTR